ncbi:unnamed protein product, partial [Pleuronectes platessa]
TEPLRNLQETSLGSILRLRKQQAAPACRAASPRHYVYNVYYVWWLAAALNLPGLSGGAEFGFTVSVLVMMSGIPRRIPKRSKKPVASEEEEEEETERRRAEEEKIIMTRREGIGEKTRRRRKRRSSASYRGYTLTRCPSVCCFAKFIWFHSHKDFQKESSTFRLIVTTRRNRPLRHFIFIPVRYFA